ncbi:MAG: Uma2 family endonuclease [Roseiflexaceae bacterium]
MSIETVKTPRSAGAENDLPQPNGVPPLQSGDHLSRAEFERRYHAHPEVKKAELIEGVVYVALPVRHTQHGHPHFNIIGWLSFYCAFTPGVSGGDNSTTLLDLENEPQPDVLLRLDPALGGKTQVTPDGYLEGPPELIVEIAASSVSYDLHEKQRAYARNGVPEYLAIQVYEQRVDWFALHDGVYEPLAADERGIIHSEVFPGLWLQPAALWSGDLAALLATLQEGLASPQHTTFKAGLQRPQGDM